MAPDKVSMPVPVLVNAPVPLITPENVVEVLLPPVVSVLAPSVTVPLPAREPIVSSALSDSLAPEDGARYRHVDEGADDMPAHIRTALTGVQLTIPIVHGRLALGRWQGIYLFEHRRSPHRREIALHLIGE